MSLTTNPSLIGQLNLSGSDVAGMLKMFSGEVHATYMRKNKIRSFIRSIQMSGPGKSLSFPFLGQASAAYHVRGEDVLDETKSYLNNIEHGERIINLDRPLVAPVFVDQWDEFLLHYDVRAAYAKELGEAMAYKEDQTLLRLLILAAREAATLSATQSTTKAGTVISESNMSTTVATLKTAVLEAMQTLVEKDVPVEEVVVCLKPAQYYMLVNDGALFHGDYGNAGNGNQKDAVIYKAYGFKVLMTNHLPNGTVKTSEAGELNTYSGDFTNTVGVAFHRDAIATVSKTGLSLDVIPKPEKLGTALLAKMIQGHGILRPECAVELKNS